eukprot:6042719-Prymnesium_polylepis.1
MPAVDHAIRVFPKDAHEHALAPWGLGSSAEDSVRQPAVQPLAAEPSRPMHPRRFQLAEDVVQGRRAQRVSIQIHVWDLDRADVCGQQDGRKRVHHRLLPLPLLPPRQGCFGSKSGLSRLVWAHIPNMGSGPGAGGPWGVRVDNTSSRKESYMADVVARGGIGRLRVPR